MEEAAPIQPGLMVVADNLGITADLAQLFVETLGGSVETGLSDLAYVTQPEVEEAMGSCTKLEGLPLLPLEKGKLRRLFKKAPAF